MVVVASSLTVLTYSAVAIAVLAVIHLLGKLWSFLQRRDEAREVGDLLHHASAAEKGLQSGYYRRPSASPHPRRSSSVMEPHLARMASQTKSSAWRGWQETRRDEATRCSVNELHQRNMNARLSLSHIDGQGRYVEVTNASGPTTLPPKTESIAGWRIFRRVSDRKDGFKPEDEMVFIFPPRTQLRSNGSLKVWAAGAGALGGRGASDFVAAEIPSWGCGDFQETMLLNEREELQASIFYTTQYLQPGEHF